MNVIQPETPIDLPEPDPCFNPNEMPRFFSQGIRPGYLYPPPGVNLIPAPPNGFPLRGSPQTEPLPKYQPPPYHPQKSYGDSSVVCFNCRAVGHFARDCPLPNPRKDGGNQRNWKNRNQPGRNQNGGKTYSQNDVDRLLDNARKDWKRKMDAFDEKEVKRRRVENNGNKSTSSYACASALSEEITPVVVSSTPNIFELPSQPVPCRTLIWGRIQNFEGRT